MEEDARRARESEQQGRGSTQRKVMTKIRKNRCSLAFVSFSLGFWLVVPGFSLDFCKGRNSKLHPCIETLNSRNLGLAKDSVKVSFGFRTLWGPRLIKDPKNVKNHWFYCVFAKKC